MNEDVVVEKSVESPASTPSSFGGFLLGLPRLLFTVDTRSLALIRMAMAFTILVDQYLALTDVEFFYSDDGCLPMSLHQQIFQFGWGPFIHNMNGSVEWQALLMIVLMGLACCMFVGVFTRTVTVACWVLLISFQTRNSLVLQGNDMVMRMFMFWSMFLPMGAKWSIDAARRHGIEYLPRSAFSMASAGMMLQVCVIYWFTAVLKWDDTWVKDFTAVYYALHDDKFVTPVGEWLSHFPFVCKILTVLTLVLEYAGPTVVLIPWANGWIRIVTAFVFIGFHLVGLGVPMRLGMFPFVSAMIWLVFLPPFFWDWCERSLARLPGSSFGENLRVRFRGWLQKAWPIDLVDAQQDMIESQPSLLTNLLLAGVLVFIFLYNLRSVSEQRFGWMTPESLRKVAFSLHLDQRWAMFAPGPNKNDGYYHIVARLRDGSEVDLFRQGEKIRWEKPAGIPAYYRNYRWRVYMMHLSTDTWKVLRPAFCEALRKQWDRDHPPSRQLQTIWIYFMNEKTQLDNKPDELESFLLYTHQCTTNEKKEEELPRLVQPASTPDPLKNLLPTSPLFPNTIR